MDCPYCAEPVKDSALTCKHCTRDLFLVRPLMAQLADAFVALPGGLGTLEELFEIWTWGMLGLHRKPYGLLEVGDYYRRLGDFLDHACGEGFVRPAQREMLCIESDVERLLDRLAAAAA